MATRRGKAPASPWRLAYADTRVGQLHLKIWPGPPDTAIPPVVCLHPVPYSGRYFDTFAALLAARTTVIAPDLPGYGGSARPAAPLPLAEHAGAVADALQTLGIGRCVPLGYHTGSAVACELALARPRKVPRLVCVTYPCLPPEERAKQMEGLGRGSLAGEELDSLRRRWRFTIHNRAAGVPLEPALTNFVEELRAGDQAWFGFQSLFDYAPEERLPRVQQDVLLINTDGSLKEATRAAATLLPEARYVEFPQMSRGIFELHAERLAGVVADFAAGQAAAAAGQTPD